jgi:hypothetical protein
VAAFFERVANSGKEDKERQLPIDRASNPLPGSPVCLAHDDVVTSLFNRRACGSDNLRPTAQKDFCHHRHF